MRTEATLDVSLTGFSDPETDVKLIEWAILPGSSTSTDGVVFKPASERGVAIPPRGHLGPVTVENKKKYRVALRATNGGGLTTVQLSEPFDATFGVFVKGVVYDGAGWSDDEFQMVKTALWGRWFGFKDPTHGIREYEWFAGTAPGKDDIVNKTTTKEQSVAKVHGLNLVQGKKYFITACAVNKIDVKKCSSSNGIVIDATSPEVAFAEFVTLSGKPYAEVGEKILLRWRGLDAESGAREFQVALGTFPGGQDILPLSRVVVKLANNETIEHQLPQVRLNSSMPSVYAKVRMYNKAGMHADALSSVLTLDGTPPHCSSVYLTRQLDTITILWTAFSDAESGIAEYSYSLSHKAGEADLYNWTTVSSDTRSAVLTGVEVESGKLMVASVRGIDQAGHVCEAHSEQIHFDTTPPEINLLQDGFNDEDADFQSDKHQVTAFWILREDFSSIEKCEWAIGTGPGLEDLRSFKPIFPAETQELVYFSATAQLHNLTVGTKYFVTVRARNHIGLEVQNSTDGFIIDTTAPSPGEVVVSKDGFKHVNFSSSQDVVGHWSGFEDGDSGMAKYEWALCHSYGDHCVQNFTDVKLETKAFNPALQLVDGHCYVVKVRGTNHAGQTAEAVSPPFTFDGSIPEAGLVFDGVGLEADEDYQPDLTTMSLTFQNFRDTETDIAFYEWCLTTVIGKCTEVAFRPMGDGPLGRFTGLDLVPGKRYFQTVRATNQAGGQATAHSDGITIDNTPPRCTTLRDGSSLSDFQYMRSGSTVTANWDVCSDDESEIASYAWAIGTKPGLADIMPLRSVGLSTSASYRLNGNRDGQKVFVTLQATNKAGLYGNISSDGVVLDSTPPSTPHIGLGTKSKPWGHYGSENEEVPVFWSAHDEHSGIDHYDVRVCYDTANGERRCRPRLENIGNTTSINTPVTDFEGGNCYYARVTAFNKAGLSSSGESSCTILDWTAPVAGRVYDGVSAIDIDYQTEAHVIRVYWEEFQDPESNIQGYFWCIGNSSVSYDNVKACCSVGHSTSAVYKSDKLMTGVRYFVSVYAVNHAGIKSSTVTSDGVMIDVDVPVATRIVDGLGKHDLNYSTTDVLLSAHWVPFFDKTSGMKEYHVGVGTKPGLDNVVGWHSVGLRNTETMAARSIAPGTRIFTTIRGLDKAGNFAEASTDGMLVDPTAPIAGTVSLVQEGGFSGYQSDSHTFRAKWSGFADSDSSLDHYEWEIVEAVSGQVHQNWTSVGLNTNVSTSAVNLPSGVAIVAKVRVFNGAGLYTEVTSMATITIDTTPPVTGRVFDGKTRGRDLVYQYNDSSLSAYWNGLYDQESPVTGFTVCAGTAPDYDDVVACFETTHRVLNVRKLNLDSGRKYQVKVVATNAAGLTTTILSNGLTIDRTAPVVGQVWDGLEESDVDAQSSLSRVSASWKDFSDDESQIVAYYWCVGTSPGGEDVVELTSVGLATVALSSGHVLTTGKKVYVTVVAENSVGLRSNATSDGVMVDGTIPLPGRIYDGPVANADVEVDFQTDRSLVEATWEPFEDPDCDIVEYMFGLYEETLDPVTGVWHNAHLVLNFSSAALNRSIRTYPKELRPNHRYSVAVAAINEAGLSAIGLSDGFIIDAAELPLGVESWNNDEGPVYGLRYVPSSQSMGASIIIDEVILPKKNASSNVTKAHKYAPYVAGYNLADPLNQYFVSIPYVGEQAVPDLSKDVFYAENVTQVTGYAAADIEVGTYQRTVSACCASEKLYANFSLAQSRMLATGNVMRFGETVAISRSGFIAVTTLESAMIVHSSKPSNVLFLKTVKTHQGQPLGLAICNERAIFISSDEVFMAELHINGSEYTAVDRGTMGISQFNDIQFMPAAAATAEFYFVTTITRTSVVHLHTIMSVNDTMKVVSTRAILLSYDRFKLDAVGRTFALFLEGKRELKLYKINATTGEVVRGDHQGTRPELSGVVTGLTFFISGVAYVAVISVDGSLSVYLITNSQLNPAKPLCRVTGLDKNIFSVITRGYKKEALMVLLVKDSSAVQTVRAFQTANGGLRCSHGGKIGVEIKNGSSSTYSVKDASIGDQLIGMSVTGLRGRELHVTAFCTEDNTRQISPEDDTFPSSCVPCPTGQSSSGGVLDNCEQCNVAGKCLTAGQQRIDAVLSNLSLTLNDTFTLEVEAVTPSGKSQLVTSAPFAVDITPPEVGMVLDGRNGLDTDYLSKFLDLELGVTFKDFNDPDSDMSHFRWCMGTAKLRCDIIPMQRTRNDSFSSLERKDCPKCVFTWHKRYYTTVEAFNGAHLTVKGSSNGFLFDNTPPVIEAVYDGAYYVDEEFININDSLLASWNASDAQSGIKRAIVRLGTSPGAKDGPLWYHEVRVQRNISHLIHRNLSGALQPKTRYFITVTVENGAGLTATKSSNGFFIGVSTILVPRNRNHTSIVFDTNMLAYLLPRKGEVNHTAGMLTLGKTTQYMKLVTSAIETTGSKMYTAGAIGRVLKPANPEKTKPKVRHLSLCVCVCVCVCVSEKNER